MITTAPPIGGRLLRAWLLPLGQPVAAERKPTDPVPQRVINRIGGPADRFTDRGLYSIHDFAATFTAAENQAQATGTRLHDLMLYPQREITVGDDTVYVDNVQIDEWPHPEHYSDTIRRFVTTVRVHLRFVP